MKILTISGSVRSDSSNAKLLDALPVLFPEHEISRYQKLQDLPLFNANAQEQLTPLIVKDWKEALRATDALIICTPEYIYNIPALLKNAFEWITQSGEIVGKRVLAITLTPHKPRGKKAMQSLIWTLQALDAQIVAQLPLYQNEMAFNEKNELVENEQLEILQDAISLL